MTLVNTLSYINNTNLQLIIKKVYKIRYKLISEFKMKKYIKQMYKTIIIETFKYWMKKENFKLIEEIFFIKDKINKSNIKKSNFIIDFECIKEKEKLIIICAIMIIVNGKIEEYAIFDITNIRLIILNKNKKIINSKPLTIKQKLTNTYYKNDYYHIYTIQKHYQNLYNIKFENNEEHILDQYLKYLN